jgi:hypothetical protein
MDTGPHSPATIGNAVTGVNQISWTDHLNAGVEDAAYATATLAAAGPFNSRFLRFNDFGFNIPLSATIVGIEAALKIKASHDAAGRRVIDSNVFFRYQGSNQPYADRARAADVFWPTVDTWITYGGPTDLWNNLNPEVTWETSPFNEDGVGFGITANLLATDGEVIAYVDAALMTIYYELAGVRRHDRRRLRCG